MDEQNVRLVSEGANRLGAPLEKEQIDKLIRFFELVAKANERFNLTAIKDEKDFAIKHIVDSLTAAKFVPKGAKLLDIGAGAGFPSVPLAVALPNVEVTALDATSKKANFIAEAAKELRLDNLRAVCGRAEEQTAMFEKFDVVTARAVASLNILLELSAPMLKTGGVFIAYKSDESELENVKTALAKLNMRLKDKVSLLLEDNRRALLLFEKTAPTPKIYPRRYGIIKKSPL